MCMQRIRQGTSRPAVALTSAFLLLSLVGCSGLRRPAPVVDRTQDPRIIEQVQARLAAEPELDAAQIRVEADGGVLRLYGSVSGIGRWQCAIRNAELVEGVQTVVDYLVIERGPREVNCQAARLVD